LGEGSWKNSEKGGKRNEQKSRIHLFLLGTLYDG